MPHGHNGDDPYEVHYSEAVRERLRKLQRQATHRGQGQAFFQHFDKLFEPCKEIRPQSANRSTISAGYTYTFERLW